MGQAGTRRVLFQDLPSSGRKRKRLLEVGARGGITQSHRRAGQTVRPRKESRASHGGKRVVRDPEMGREPGFRGGDTAAPDRSHFAVCVVGGGHFLTCGTGDGGSRGRKEREASGSRPREDQGICKATSDPVTVGAEGRSRGGWSRAPATR